MFLDTSGYGIFLSRTTGNSIDRETMDLLNFDSNLLSYREKKKDQQL